MPSESDVHLDTPESASDGARSPRTLRPFILAGHPRRVQVRDLLTEYPGRQPSTVIILRRLGSVLRQMKVLPNGVSLPQNSGY
jgi:hypothetical protein